MVTEQDKCPLCGRVLGQANIDFHHLVPKTFNGKEGITLHRVCHRNLHASISEREMANYYHTIDRLLESEQVQKFVKWIAKKTPEYYVSTDETTERKGKRRR